MTPDPIPVLDAQSLAAGQPNPRFLQTLEAAARDWGCFYLENHGISALLCDQTLAQTRRFFLLPEALKNEMHLRHSPHFRGYSQMKNARDWREQVHFGPENTGASYTGKDWAPLIGPNCWPVLPDTRFRETVLEYFGAAEQLGTNLLRALWQAAGAGANTAETAEKPYTLLKLLCYYPQPGGTPQPGVAPHCDWSWLTLLLQDDTPGLQVLSADGQWVEAPPRHGALLVNLGELLELWSAGAWRAAPHQVINPSQETPRMSVPVFINPALGQWVQPMPGAGALRMRAQATEPGHVHRVAQPGSERPPFLFGDSEWARKGLGRWCYERH
jgi:isopenicillin N synthase-like dioxygenase